MMIVLHDYEVSEVYPAPIVSVRYYRDDEHLYQLMDQDLATHGKEAVLVASLFGTEKTWVRA